MLGDPRTNNNSEGGNNAINLCFGTSSPIMPKFVEKLQLYNCEQETKLEQLFRCRNPNRVPRTSEVIRTSEPPLLATPLMTDYVTAGPSDMGTVN